ncbi:MAG TPA: hypothetical protein DCE71_01910 [Parachlamydiales bacterium]|nr:hypothetical protein [Parachlamydiales bacterium]
MPLNRKHYISKDCSWKDHCTNFGIICFSKKKETSSSSLVTPSESPSSERKISDALSQSGPEKPKQPQFRSVEDLLFAIRNKSSQKRA